MSNNENHKLIYILMLHNRYQYAGGEDSSTLAEIEVLSQFGHKVTLIEKYNNEINEYSSLDKLNLFFQTAWNSQEYSKARSRLQEIQPHLLHVQNFFPLFSPSLHSAAKSLNIPTVQHLRNFRLGCLNSYLFRNGTVCEDCVGKNPWRGVVYRCYRNSLPSSLAVWNMLTYNRWRNTWQRDVDAFITPSQFAAQKLIEIGIPQDRLYIKPNVTSDPLSDQTIPPFPHHPTFLYVGRLSPEKGVMTLLRAWEKVAEPEWQLNLVGDGQQQEELKQFVRDRALSNVHFLGYQPKNQVIEAIKQSTAIVVPSQWYETFGRVVIEAFACGRPALISNLGALAELVQDHETGFLIPHNAMQNWVEALRWSGNNLMQMEKMGKKARQVYQQKYTPEINYQQMINIYQTILK